MTRTPTPHADTRGERGDGETTRRMKAAPQNAVFVWCNGHTDYPRHLARALGRADLVIETPGFFTNYRYRGIARPVVVDHAFDPFAMSARDRDEYFRAMQYLSMRGLVS